MSKSYHVTRKDLKGLSKRELDEMAEDKDSLLNEYAEKSSVKREVKKKRKEEKDKNNDTPTNPIS
ncbi:hypothetical protein I2I11_11875 [Pontibacter sp. 172403-2]|uniref:hypothetical protein n=1 Tax=Pontibacter rufus TaxID=2791028 RepID=UPI0018AF665D|nr:hypothetical protein [Pontibacter sp. 172403-2]MBF9253992.1 hypothetical protein [Pontibacter sp. 172403-2]